MNEKVEKTVSSFGELGEDIYYHHTRTESSPDGYSVAPGVHTQHEVLYLVEGELTYVIEGERYKVTKGDMIFVAPNEIHSLEVDRTQPYERIVLLFDMDILRVMMQKMGTRLHAFSYEGKNRFHVIDRSDVKRYGLERILSEITSDAEDEYKKLSIISRLISFVIGIDRIISEGSSQRRTPDSRDPLVSAVAQYVDAHIGEALNLDRLSAEVGVSKSTLCHKFSSAVNMSVSRYITVKKMHRAEELLKKGYSATSAAEAVGYLNYTSFFYNYKRLMGRSPSEDSLKKEES